MVNYRDSYSDTSITNVKDYESLEIKYNTLLAEKEHLLNENDVLRFHLTDVSVRALRKQGFNSDPALGKGQEQQERQGVWRYPIPAGAERVRV
jgi:hypothetical protein